MIEYVQLGLGTKQKYFPLEKVVITFFENGTYQMQSDLIFDPPKYDRKTLHHIFNANNALLQKMNSNIDLNASEKKDLVQLPDTYLICYLNGFDDAKNNLEQARHLVKKKNKKIYLALKEALRILRKVKYN